MDTSTDIHQQMVITVDGCNLSSFDYKMYEMFFVFISPVKFIFCSLFELVDYCLHFSLVAALQTDLVH